MGKVKQALRWLVSRAGYLLLPRIVRLNVIKAMILAEEPAKPRESVKWMLGVYDYVAGAIDRQSIRWGNGVHKKHELMDGIHEFFYSRIPPGSHVLDLGCGRGTVADAIARHAGATVTGIDLDKSLIEVARRKYTDPHLGFIHGDVFKDIPELERVDVIVLSSVLEHLKNRAAFLRQLGTRFHPARFLIRVPTLERTHYVALKRDLGLNPFIDPTHELEYSPATFKSEMAEAGLRVAHMEIRWGDIWAECIPAE